MKKQKLPKDLFIISVLTTITVFFWILFDLYRIYTKNSIPPVMQKKIETLNPELNAKALDDLSKRRKIEREELIIPIVSLIPTEIPE